MFVFSKSFEDPEIKQSRDYDASEVNKPDIHFFMFEICQFHFISFQSNILGLVQIWCTSIPVRLSLVWYCMRFSFLLSQNNFLYDCFDCSPFLSIFPTKHLFVLQMKKPPLLKVPPLSHRDSKVSDWFLLNALFKRQDFDDMVIDVSRALKMTSSLRRVRICSRAGDVELAEDTRR